MHPTILLFGIELSVYGLILPIAYLLVFIIGMKLAKQRGLDHVHAARFLVFAIFGVIIGSKLLFFFTDGLGYYQSMLQTGRDVSFTQGIAALFGGYRFLGGVVAALCMIWIYAGLANVDAFTYMPIAMIPAALALSVYRMGCYSAGCCYGIETHSILGVHFPSMAEGVRVLPLQLFESAAYFIMFVTLLILSHRKVKDIVYSHVIVGGFAGVRFITEYFRPDAKWLFPFLSITQLLCMIAVIYIFATHNIYKRRGEASPDFKKTVSQIT